MECSVCGHLAEFECSACGRKYCSEGCQRADWKLKHEALCTRPVEMKRKWPQKIEIPDEDWKWVTQIAENDWIWIHFVNFLKDRALKDPPEGNLWDWILQIGKETPDWKRIQSRVKQLSAANDPDFRMDRDQFWKRLQERGSDPFDDQESKEESLSLREQWKEFVKFFQQKRRENRLLLDKETTSLDKFWEWMIDLAKKWPSIPELLSRVRSMMKNEDPRSDNFHLFNEKMLEFMRIGSSMMRVENPTDDPFSWSHDMEIAFLPPPPPEDHIPTQEEDDTVLFEEQNLEEEDSLSSDFVPFSQEDEEEVSIVYTPLINKEDVTVPWGWVQDYGPDEIVVYRTCDDAMPFWKRIRHAIEERERFFDIVVRCPTNRIQLKSEIQNSLKLCWNSVLHRMETSMEEIEHWIWFWMYASEMQVRKMQMDHGNFPAIAFLSPFFATEVYPLNWYLRLEERTHTEIKDFIYACFQNFTTDHIYEMAEAAGLDVENDAYRRWFHDFYFHHTPIHLELWFYFQNMVQVNNIALAYFMGHNYGSIIPIIKEKRANFPQIHFCFCLLMFLMREYDRSQYDQ